MLIKINKFLKEKEIGIFVRQQNGRPVERTEKNGQGFEKVIAAVRSWFRWGVCLSVKFT